jgi:hypothetical protein
MRLCRKRGEFPFPLRVTYAIAALLFLVLPLSLAGQTMGDTFRFAVTCDQRYYSGPGGYDTSNYYRGVCQAIDTLGPGAFMVSPGDIDPVEDVQWTNEEYIDSAYLWYPVAGNHELPGSGHEPYYGANMDTLRNMNAGGNSLPNVVNIGPTNCEETTYSFDYQNCHFIALNQYYNGTIDTGTDGDVLDSLYYWLADDLAINTKPHVFVFGHEPAYPQPDAYNGRERHVGDSLDKYATRRDRFWALLSDYGVLAYVCGHTHNFSAVRHFGVWQLDAGHARGQGDTGAPSTFFLVDVAGDDQSDVTITVYRDIHDGTYDYDDLVHVIDASEYRHAIDGMMDFDAQNELLDSLATDVAYGGDGLYDRLYLSWDDDTLYLAYEMSDFNSDGDLFAYFDSDTGGTGFSTDWYTVHQFPQGFRADYAVCVENNGWQDKRTWNAGLGEWETTSLGDTDCRAYVGWSGNPVTEISVPFSEIAYQPDDTLELMVYCQQEAGGDLWVAFPPGNPTGPCPLNRYYRYESLAPGAIPNQTVEIVVQDLVPPAPVAELQVTKAGQAIRLLWSPVFQDTAGCPEAVSHYVVYRDTVPDLIPGTDDSLGIALDTIFLDTTAAVDNASVHHFYAIQTVDQGHNKSVSSNTVGEFDRELVYEK